MTDKVGPGNPPRHTRFKKGHSGNPRGRPRKRREDPLDESAFEILFEQKVTRKQGDGKEDLSIEDGLLHSLVRQALAGRRAAQREVIKMIERREKARARRALKASPPGPAQIFEHPTSGEENAVVRVLDIARPAPSFHESADESDRIKLELWAVQMALSRRRGGRALTQEQIEEIQSCTRDPDAIEWPRRYQR